MKGGGGNQRGWSWWLVGIKGWRFSGSGGCGGSQKEMATPKTSEALISGLGGHGGWWALKGVVVTRK